MKTRFFAALLALLLMLNLTACGDTQVASVLEQAAEEAGAVLGDAGEGDDAPVEIPQCVKDLTEEENALLNGTCQNGVYVNEYFGYKFTLPEGGKLTRLHDNTAEWTEPVSLLQCYETEEGGLAFWADIPNLDGYIMIGVQALKEDEIGLDEEGLVKKNIENIWEINKIFGEDAGPELSTAVFAGEEHPAAIHESEISSGTQKSIEFYIPKGDFKYTVSIYVNNGEWEPLLSLFDKA